MMSERFLHEGVALLVRRRLTSKPQLSSSHFHAELAIRSCSLLPTPSTPSTLWICWAAETRLFFFGMAGDMLPGCPCNWLGCPGERARSIVNSASSSPADGYSAARRAKMTC